MKGCRPLTEPEIDAVLKALSGNRYPLRDRAFFLAGLKTGFRVSELLSLTVGDVFQNGRIVDEIAVARRNMKKKREGRNVPLDNEQAREALLAWVTELIRAGGGNSENFLFRSREGKNKALGRDMAWKILKIAFARCGMNGKLATHSMRKTFAKDMRQLLENDLPALQEAMGHAQITSTMSYISSDAKKIRDAFKKI